MIPTPATWPLPLQLSVLASLLAALCLLGVLGVLLDRRRSRIRHQRYRQRRAIASTGLEISQATILLPDGRASFPIGQELWHRRSTTVTGDSPSDSPDGIHSINRHRTASAASSNTTTRALP